MKKPSRLELKLAQFLKDNKEMALEFGTLIRTRSGWSQLSMGAWVWWAYVKSEGVRRAIGSQWRLSDLMRDLDKIECNWEDGQLHLDPKQGHRIC